MATPPPDGRGRRATADLTTNLEPGETVVFWTRGRSLAAAVIPFGLAFVAIAVLPPLLLLDQMVMAPETLNWHAIRIAALIDAGILLIAVAALLKAWRRQSLGPDDFMITNRRVLFADSYWVDEIALDEIDRVGWANRDGLRYPTIIGNGQTIWLSHLRERDAAIKALADATGTKAPPSLGLLAVVDPAHVGMATVFAFIVLTFKIVLVVTGAAEFAGLIRSFDGTLFFAAAAAVVLGLALGTGKAVGHMVLATLMRPFMTPEQMQAGLCAGQPETPHLRAALRWAGLLYGRPLPYLAH